MGLNAREGEGEHVLFIMSGEITVGHELRSSALPSAPDLRRRKPHCRIIAGKAAVVGGQQIATLSLRDVGEVWLPRVGIEDRRTALVEPVDLLPTEEEDTAEDELGDAIGMSLGIDRKSTRLNSSHRCISYAVFCL